MEYPLSDVITSCSVLAHCTSAMISYTGVRKGRALKVLTLTGNIWPQTYLPELLISPYPALGAKKVKSEKYYVSSINDYRIIP